MCVSLCVHWTVHCVSLCVHCVWTVVSIVCVCVSTGCVIVCHCVCVCVCVLRLCLLCVSTHTLCVCVCFLWGGLLGSARESGTTLPPGVGGNSSPSADPPAPKNIDKGDRRVLISLLFLPLAFVAVVPWLWCTKQESLYLASLVLEALLSQGDQFSALDLAKACCV